MKTAISLPDSLFEEGEQLAQQLGISRSELYATALEAYLQARRAARVTQQLDDLYEKEASGLDEATVQLQVLSLPEEEW
jgi:metal-responsive CopG/Arc/MetJ family transcriptional regulator